MTVRIEAGLLIAGRGEPVSNGVVVLEGDTITYTGPGHQAPETPEADTGRSESCHPRLEERQGRETASVTRHQRLGESATRP